MSKIFWKELGSKYFELSDYHVSVMSFGENEWKTSKDHLDKLTGIRRKAVTATQLLERAG